MEKDINESESLSRNKLLSILHVMPYEAFSWLVLACIPKSMTRGAYTQIWPDGIGGFSKESQESINAIRVAAVEYLNLPK